MLGVKQSVDEEAQAAKLAAASKPAQDNVDWFQRLQEDQTTSQGGDTAQWPGYYNEPPGFGKSGQDETLVAKTDSSEWFMSASEEKAPEIVDASRPTGVTDWLKRKNAQENQSGGMPLSADPADSASAPIPDWLAFAQPAAQGIETPAPAVSGDLPDWLSDFKADQQAAVEIPSITPASSEELPDWLRSAQPEQPVAPSIPSSQPAQAEPDWLSAFAGPADTAEISSAVEPAREGLPNWLAAAEAGIVAASVSMPDEKKTAELPSVLKGRPGPAPEPVSQDFDLPPVTISGDEDLPDWLSELPGAPGPVAPVKKPTAPLPPVPPAEQKPPAEKSKSADWLVGAAAVAGTAKTVSVFTDQPTAGDDALSMEMPDWLSGIKPAEAAVASAATSSETRGGTSDSLTPGELPAWVQAMRPVESVIAETAGDVDDEQFVESQGPLAGFQNVLPFVPGLISIRRPAVYSSKLQVNTGQQNNAALLEGLLSSESDAAKVKHKSRMHYNKFLRWMIAALLIILVAIPIVFGSTLTPINTEPPLYPRELVAANKVITELAANPNVLVVFDYEPAFSGEMTTASAPVLSQLMAKGATLTVVSSLPTGSVQANLLLATYLASYNYLNSSSYINLGYIPGGAAGIYNFATKPTETIPVDVEGNQVWSDRKSFLADTRQLSDFDAMVILVDSSETARVWIEQSRLPLGVKPLLMVISAQAEPMVVPYYDSNQVQGMVTGLFGGANYELITNSPATARIFWDAFAVAFFVAEIIVVVGGVWALIAAWQARLARKDEEA